MIPVEDNWIETSAIGASLVSWKVVRSGKIIHSDEWAGNDPTGLRAYRAGLDWVGAHFPRVAFHWRHQALAWTVRAAAEAVGSKEEGPRCRPRDTRDRSR